MPKVIFNREVVLIVQIVLSLLLVILILIQSRGSGLSGIFSAEASQLSFRSRRGVEKLVFFLTIVVLVLFLAVSLILFASVR